MDSEARMLKEASEAFEREGGDKRCTVPIPPLVLQDAASVEGLLPQSLAAVLHDPHHGPMLHACAELLVRKGNDYSQGSEFEDSIGRCSNFFETAIQLHVTPEQVVGTHMHKHMLAILRYCAEGHVDSEPINMRIADVINYALLLWKLINVKAQLEQEKKDHE
jgi:hypothetical protein